MKTYLIIGGIVFFIALIAWTIYEMKNAQERPPDDTTFKIDMQAVPKSNSKERNLLPVPY